MVYVIAYVYNLSKKILFFDYVAIYRDYTYIINRK